MKKKEPRSLKDILSGQTDSLFSALAQQKIGNDTLLGRVRAILPSQIAQHLVAVTHREDILVLVADSPAWANRLRYESENLRKQLISKAYFTEPEPGNSSQDPSLPCLGKIVTRTAAGKIV